MAIYMHKDTAYQDNLEALMKLNPHAACHDGVWHYFIKEIPEANRTYDAVNISEWGLAGDELAWQFAALITPKSNKDVVPRFDVYTGHSLYQHPAYRIWCANYQDDEAGRKQFKADWQYIKEMVTRMNPEAAELWPEWREDMSFVEGRETIYSAISNFLNT